VKRNVFFRETWERVKHVDWFKEKYIELAIRESHKNGQLYIMEIKRPNSHETLVSAYWTSRLHIPEYSPP
jgi:hypothetical protein